MLSFNIREYKRVQTGHGQIWGSNTVRLLEMTIDSDLNFVKHSLELCKSTNKKKQVLCHC